MKKIILLISVIVSTVCVSYAQGIKFEHGPYEEALTKAKQENKLLFVAMTMRGCGPCLLMKQKVYSLPEVGKVYNEKFVCWYINITDTNEGIDFSLKTGVTSCPTYLWIDPNTDKIVHQSSSSKRPELFLELAKKPFNKAQASGYLIEEYNKGNRDFKLLANLYAYYDSENKRDKMRLMEEDLVKQHGVKFSYKPLAEFYFETIHLRNSLMTQYMLKHKKRIIKMYGKDRVLEKIAKLK